MPLIDRDDSFMAVIDVQRDFYRDRADVDAVSFAGFVDRVAWMAGVARALDVPTVVTVEAPEYQGDTAEPVLAALGADTAIVRKPVFGLTYVDDIRRVVEGFGRRTAVLVGMETDVCVAHSALGLAELGYRVVAVTDALFSPGDAHEHGLHRLRQSGVELVSAKALLYEWVRTLEAAVRFEAEHPELAKPPGFHL